MAKAQEGNSGTAVLLETATQEWRDPGPRTAKLQPNRGKVTDFGGRSWNLGTCQTPHRRPSMDVGGR
jgi:hypothetical protein